jgi:hypothetical protein
LSSLVNVCVVLSSLRITIGPAATVAGFGENWNVLIVTAVSPLGLAEVGLDSFVLASLLQAANSAVDAMSAKARVRDALRGVRAEVL